MSVLAAVSDVSVRLGHVQALDNVSLRAEPGTFVALLGPSGSGKTTMLNVLAGFIRPDSGSVLFDDRDVSDIPPYARDLGVVFQSYALFPHMSVGQNLEFPLRMRKVSSRERQRRALEALRTVGLGDYSKRKVSTLSGGQRQRVALARAIVFEPRLLLLDEPMAALDKQLRESMQHEIKDLQRRVGVTTIAVTHDQVEALSMADVVVVLNEGRVEQIGSPEDLYLRPESLFVARFLGEANLVEVTDGVMHGFGRLNDGVTGTAILRPEHLRIRQGEVSAQALWANAEVTDVTFQGARVRVRVSLTDHPAVRLTVNADYRDSQLRNGDLVHIEVDADAVHVVAGTTRPADLCDENSIFRAPANLVTEGNEL